MIQFKSLQRGQILKVLHKSDPDQKVSEGDLVKVTDAFVDGVKVENEDGEEAEFLNAAGAEALETTEFQNEFLEEKKQRIKREQARDEQADADRAKAFKEKKEAKEEPKKVASKKKK